MILPQWLRDAVQNANDETQRAGNGDYFNLLLRVLLLRWDRV